MDERSAQETQSVELYVDAAGGRKTAGGIGVIAVCEATPLRRAEMLSAIPAAPQLLSEVLGIYTAIRSLMTFVHALQTGCDQHIIVYSDSQPALRAIEAGSSPLARRTAQAVHSWATCHGTITLRFCSARGCARGAHWMRRADELSREARAWIRRG